MNRRHHTRLVTRTSTVVAMAGLVILLGAPAALAHVELSSSTPADGTTVTGPLAEIRMEFSTDSEPAGDGLILYDASGTRISSTTRVASGTIVAVVPDEPLPPGRYAVTWTMRAGDAHPKSGGIEFTVQAPATEAAPAPQADTPTPNTAPPPPDVSTEPTPSILDVVVVESSTSTGDWLGRLARGASITAVLLGIGAFAFGLLVFEGSRAEARVIGYWARRAGAVILLVAPLEVLGQSIVLSGGSIFGGLGPGSLGSTLGGSFGLAILLRIAGGGALFLGTQLVTVTSPLPPARPGPSWNGHGGGVAVAPRLERERFHVAASPIALAGIAALTASFLFDGHTASMAPGWLMRFASAIHVLAGATWVGGVAMLARTLSGRHRRGEPLEAARLVIPFSTVAGAAVAMVGLAGGVMALVIAKTPVAFFTTAWGRAMTAKLVLVGVAGAIGAYNHQYVVPMLKTSPDHPMAISSIRATVRVEAGLLVAVGAATAIMVGLAAV